MSRQKKVGRGKFAKFMDREVKKSEVLDAEAAVAAWAVERDISLEQAFDELLAMGIGRASALDRYYSSKPRGRKRRSPPPPRRRPGDAAPTANA